jgi:hypothetical protein
MKTIITVFAVVISMTATAQLTKSSEKHVVEIIGVPIQGDVNVAKQKFIDKGFKDGESVDGGIHLSGRLMNRDVNLYLITTPKTKQFCKAAIFFDEHTSWSSLKSEFKEFEEILTKKYGKPYDTFKFFDSPYKEYDGYETTAVRIGKCNYFTFWKEAKSLNSSGYTIAVQINKGMTVAIQYENKELMDLRTSEQDEINQKTF